MIEDVKQEAEQRMKKSLEALGVAFAKIRTGRAHPSILDGVMVSYYGVDTPLKQVANISVEDGRTLAVSAWEKPLVPAIEKAIMAANLGLNPSTSGDLVRVPMPALTEETRRDMAKLAKADAESGRVSIRNARRDANSYLKELLKEKEITEDDLKRGEDQIQKLTDSYVAEVEKMLQDKEADLMKV
ncbi:ribosome recycling factor [Oleiphilus sp. HI0071]|uniref:ribosome recycling factor n=1 Tax=unclassified Oleiphilus TaxID=2631174 RepID=UPI0007C22484|nr:MULTISPECIES: ribosome recycling factor [unclassified Oleiphilus]KZY62738.1 ribosome recycling factor [Oleiphilus sp. HI0065]KZY82423.1 ribosome recycling factor [Oleiphilus sp. HI0071]KZZ03833.1 ribosome recycling factor [Oleiphilus sp. HI0073]KZZ40557.1 ribosome recycling factor [Oleiphilus sp. HI0118]KZZ52262.1 ribosome recycling factor [Oleiphilus sp. HI0122]KZZ76606.1 ribosome recycling factor [Oleiphilus sp. HI0130]KZZ78717.1 ribosome recycling factor [Oleiphilus sp. HI0133]